MRTRNLLSGKPTIREFSQRTGNRELQNLAAHPITAAGGVRFNPNDTRAAAETQFAIGSGNGDGAADHFATVEGFRSEAVEPIAAEVQRCRANGRLGTAAEKLYWPVQPDAAALPPFGKCVHGSVSGAGAQLMRCTWSAR